MKKWTLILLLACLSCVGQKEDPELVPDPEVPEVPQGEAEGTRFFRRVLALEFTGTWCQYCPRMTQAMEDAKELRPGRIVDIAVHCYDAFSPPVSDNFAAEFKITSFPSVVLDMDAQTVFGRSEPSLFVSYVDKALETEACGLAMSCAEGTLTVKVKAVQQGTYSLVVAVVEDGLVADQSGYGANYVNTSVLRKLLVSGIKGDSLGTLATEEEKVVAFEVDPTENQRFVAFVLLNGKSVNALSCKPKENIPYYYEKDDL
jgi:thiol-disulfide isomerase/thioredoxin